MRIGRLFCAARRRERGRASPRDSHATPTSGATSAPRRQVLVTCRRVRKRVPTAARVRVSLGPVCGCEPKLTHAVQLRAAATRSGSVSRHRRNPLLCRDTERRSRSETALTRFGNERVRDTCVPVDDYPFVDVGGDSQRFWPLPDPHFCGPALREVIRNVRPPRSLRHTNSTSAPDACSSTVFRIA